MVILNFSSYHSAPESSHPFFTFDSFLPLWTRACEVALMHLEHEPHWHAACLGTVTPISPWAPARQRCRSLRSFLWSPATQALMNHTQHVSLSQWPPGAPKNSCLIEEADTHSWPNCKSSEQLLEIPRLREKRRTLQENRTNKISFITTLNGQELNFSLSFVCLRC